YWKKSIRYPISQNHVVSVGYPFIDEELHKWKNVRKKSQILFISQGFIGIQLSQIALALSQKIESGFSIAYKLHPSENDRWRDIYPWLVGSKVEVIDRKESNLHKLFAESTVQVGVASTALYEGLAHGLDTYILNISGAEYFDDLAKEGVVTMISSADDIVEHIEKRKPTNSIDTERYFMSNSVANIIQFLNSIADISIS
ncbi:MAG: hypothetical protein ACXAB5_03650, partial [Candidatus Thorarchaeota archaeon]